MERAFALDDPAAEPVVGGKAVDGRRSELRPLVGKMELGRLEETDD